MLCLRGPQLFQLLKLLQLFQLSQLSASVLCPRGPLLLCQQCSCAHGCPPPLPPWCRQLGEEVCAAVERLTSCLLACLATPAAAPLASGG